MNITETNIFETLMANETISTRDENGRYLPKAVREELMMELTRNLVKAMSRETEIDFRKYKLDGDNIKISKKANGTFIVENHSFGSNAEALRNIICDITGEDPEDLKERKFTTRQLGGQAWHYIQTAMEKREEELELKARKIAEEVEVEEEVEV